jgi:hypothetical protein
MDNVAKPFVLGMLPLKETFRVRMGDSVAVPTALPLEAALPER